MVADIFSMPCPTLPPRPPIPNYFTAATVLHFPHNIQRIAQTWFILLHMSIFKLRTFP